MPGHLTCETVLGGGQAPRWLARWAVCPPEWGVHLFVGVAGLVALAAVYRLRQRGWSIDIGTQQTMLVVAWTAAAVAGATLASVRWTSLPYLADVGVGFTTGYGAVLAAQARSVRSYGARLLPSALERVAAAWAALAVVALVGPMLLGGTEGTAVSMGRFWLVLLGGSMTGYNAVELADADG